MMNGQEMTNKYESYKNINFSYNYPYSWEKRNQNYLKLVDSRRTLKEYIEPLVYRLRFYNIDGELINDRF